MSEKTTYTAVLFGPGMIGHGDELELEYVNGSYQPEIVTEYDEPEGKITRTWRLGHETEEPVPYRFVGEHDSGGEPTITN
ncbi:hypothetical protein [Microterricola viridarii]|uniref:Uncharacterized protein n=1 Tax=Microterricola viridarii TaxID=412690 RepID=A0A1H1YED2_9MICO|nr:hypothetical protein [Microterricola viridarii]SDT19754.1 hypothetical protein SAMN04489834_3059 [Microterricola viridarii]